MIEEDLYNALMDYIITWKDFVMNHFPQLVPKLPQPEKQLSLCYRCGLSIDCSEPCTFHDDDFSLLVPTAHLGLIVGRERTKLKKIILESGVRYLDIPKRTNENNDKATVISIRGTRIDVRKAEKIIMKDNKQLSIKAGSWKCCFNASKSVGCKKCPVHLEDKIFQDSNILIETKDRPSARVFALDCEWVYTTRGGELARVTLLDHSGTVKYDSLVKPPVTVYDHKSRFSGIYESDLAGISKSLKDVQAEISEIISSSDILIGHSLQHDLQVLHLVHRKVVDTSLVFPHKDGLPKKNKLRFLAGLHLKRLIQQSTHDSKEDALASLDLMKVKVSEVQKPATARDLTCENHEPLVKIQTVRPKVTRRI